MTFLFETQNWKMTDVLHPLPFVATSRLATEDDDENPLKITSSEQPHFHYTATTRLPRSSVFKEGWKRAFAPKAQVSF